MTSVCDHCTNEIDQQFKVLYTTCPSCNQITTVTSQDEEFLPDLHAKNINISIQRGKFESISTVQQLMKNHTNRLSDLETQTEICDNRLDQIERLIRVTLGWQCPDCLGELVLNETGKMHCSECTTTYPQRPRLEDS